MWHWTILHKCDENVYSVVVFVLFEWSKKTWNPKFYWWWHGRWQWFLCQEKWREKVSTNIRINKSFSVIKSPYRPPGPPTFKKSQDEMQTLAAGNCGHRVELFCHYNRGCPMSELSWTKDGLPLQERGRETGLSTIRISKNGKLVIEVLNLMKQHEYQQYHPNVNFMWLIVLMFYSILIIIYMKD